MIRQFALGVLVLFLAENTAVADWVTLQGQVTFPKAAAIPEAKELKVEGQDKDHCLSKGPITADDLIINPKSRGIKNVWVYLRPDSTERAAKLDPAKDIHPDLHKDKVKPKTQDVDQPCCMFIPRIFAIREGDFVNYKNSSSVSHNTNLSADAPSPSFNKTIAAGGNYQDPKPFAAQRSPVQFSCSIHPWMGGQFMVFDHPYFTVTDADGNFEIKNAPEGKYRIVYRHENGYHKGKDGSLGWPVAIKGDKDKTMKLDAVEFEFPK